jgi:hypothetical protein
MDTIGKFLGISEIHIDVDALFKEYGVQQFDSTISRAEAIQRNTDIVECDRCGVTGGYTNMMRWHFENCSTKLRTCEQCGNTIPKQGVKPNQYKVKKYCNENCYQASKKGKICIVMTEEVKQKLRAPKTEEHKRKLSECRKGRKFGPRR